MLRCATVEQAVGAVLTSSSLLELPVCCNGVPTMHGKLCGTVSPAKPHLTNCTFTLSSRQAAASCPRSLDTAALVELVPYPSSIITDYC